MITQYSFGLNTHASKNNNVKDIWKTWSCEEIRADLQPNRSAMINICQNLTSDFNKGTIIRSHNAFLGKSVYIVGKRKYDKRGAVGTYHLETVYHADTFEEVSEVEEVLEVEELTLADQPREYVNFIGIERVGKDSRLAWIAYKYYAQKDLWVFIYEANRDIIKDPTYVLPGQYIRIPELDEKYRNLYNPELRQLVDSLAAEYLK